jgi:hypothetical protein
MRKTDLSLGDFKANDMTRKRTSENDLVVTGTGAVAPARRKGAIRPRAKRAAEPIESLAPTATEPETVAPQADVASSVYTPTYEEIAALAYTYWETRGCQGGCPEEDWLRAEQELRVRTSAAIA